MDNSPVISLVIVDFFKAERVVDNVRMALKQKGDFSLQVVVIDNSCDPRNKRILEKLPKSDNVHVLYNNNNCGYVAACNEGVSLFSSDYVFLVNPDIAWKADTTITAILNKFASDERIGVIGTRQINDDGSTPDTVRRFPDLIAQVARRTFLRTLPLV
ncbi:glycosyltransferase family 2 protein [Endozoicomonas ascidiicola]|uniref:glycosyltransferase family 2 protein n=1 Tax=Endozoicomonas ascidiicola TaxID=1698521 RepID=UPI000833653D|nr:glycosyltransferase [Endozoicomonas ascidiicola]